MKKIILDQLEKVEIANLDNFTPDALKIVIPKHTTPVFTVESCYLIHLKPAAFINEAVKVNWNRGSVPRNNYMKVDIANKVGKMVKVIGVGYDIDTNTDLPDFWSGWLNTDEIEILKCI